MKSYDIAKEFEALEELMANVEFDPETGEEIDNSEALIELSASLKGELDHKLDNIEYLKRERKDKVNGLKDEIKRLQDRVKMFEGEVAKLVNLQNFLLGGEKEKTDKFTFFYKTTESVHVTNEDALDKKYIVTSTKPDKAEIKKALKAGEEIAGAELEEKSSLSVR